MNSKRLSSENDDSNKSSNLKINVVNCQQNCKNCKTVLTEINRLFTEAEHYQLDKEYQFSILALKNAFNKTHELTEHFEQKCAQLFRMTIVESLENIHRELKKMTTGFFRKKRYKESYLLANETLNEFKKELPAGKERNLRTPPPAKNIKSGISAG